MSRKNRFLKDPTQNTVSAEPEPDPVITVDTEPEPELPPCGAWCFILGPGAGAFCALEQDHEGEHSVHISVFAEPASRFTIYWQLEKQE